MEANFALRITIVCADTHPAKNGVKFMLLSVQMCAD